MRLLTTIGRASPLLVRSIGAFVLLSAVMFAVTMRQAHAAGAEPLLPHLVADPPDGIELVTDSSTGAPRLLLRFNGYIHNQGPGALDLRGHRDAPHVSTRTTEEVERARETQSPLPARTEEELAVPSMAVFQRIFTTSAGEANIERAHLDEPNSAQMIYSSADGHHHWHLQHAARYSLWDDSRSAEVAPAQKVGFCLEDSQHVEPGVGPGNAVYADAAYPYQDFCQHFRPEVVSVEVV